MDHQLIISYMFFFIENAATDIVLIVAGKMSVTSTVVKLNNGLSMPQLGELQILYYKVVNGVKVIAAAVSLGLIMLSLHTGNRTDWEREGENVQQFGSATST